MWRAWRTVTWTVKAKAVHPHKLTSSTKHNFVCIYWYKCIISCLSFPKISLLMSHCRCQRMRPVKTKGDLSRLLGAMCGWVDKRWAFRFTCQRLILLWQPPAKYFAGPPKKQLQVTAVSLPKHRTSQVGTSACETREIHHYRFVVYSLNNSLYKPRSRLLSRS